MTEDDWLAIKEIVQLIADAISANNWSDRAKFLAQAVDKADERAQFLHLN